MIRSRLTLLSWLVPSLLIHASCGQQPGRQPAESVEFVEIPHVRGTNLPRWAACWFPHEADAGAVRRAQPCPAEAEATTVYTPRDVQGCWLLTGEVGKPPLESPFFSGPLRLEAEISRKMRAWNWATAGDYDVQPLAHIPDSMAFDTAGFVTYWTFAAPDSVSIIRSRDVAGTHLSFRVRGDSMVGMERAGPDIIDMSMDTMPDPVTFIRGRRVACPPAGAETHA